MAQIQLVPITTPVTLDDGFRHGDQYHYYDTIGTPKYYQSLLAKAATYIQILDTSFMEGIDANVFKDVKQEGIKISILTLSQYSEDTNNISKRLHTFADNIKRVLDNNGVSQYEIHIKVANRPLLKKNWHDRYLIIDESDAYLVGSSMNNMISSDRSFGICKLSNQKDIDIVKDIFNDFFTNKCNARNSVQTTRKKP